MKKYREWWISKGSSRFADNLTWDEETESENKKHRPDSFYDLVSPNDSIEGGIHVVEHSALTAALEELRAAREVIEITKQDYEVMRSAGIGFGPRDSLIAALARLDKFLGKTNEP